MSLYKEQCKAGIAVKSGAEIDFEAGSALKLAGTAVTATAAQLSSYGKGKPPVVAAAVDGAIAIAPGVVKITKAGIAALTLADPAAGDEGTVMIITAATAFAHTVSNAAGSGFNSGGALSDVATFGGAIGDTMVIVAVALKWHAVSLRNVVLG